MECAFHLGQAAVVQCQVCTKGLCRECAEKFTPPLFLDCAHKVADQEMTEAHARIKDIKWLQIKKLMAVIWALALMALGTKAAMFNSAPGEWWFNLFFYFGVGGLPWALAWSSLKDKSPEAQIKGLRNDVFMLSMANGNVAVLLFGLIVRLVITFALAAIITPFCIAFSI